MASEKWRRDGLAAGRGELSQALFDEIGGDALVAEVLGEFGSGVVDGGWNRCLLARGDHVAGRGERIDQIDEGRHGKVGEFADEVVLGALENETAVVDDGVQNTSDPPVFVYIGGLVDGLEVDLDVEALSFEDEHVGIEFLHGVGLDPEHFGAPPLVEFEHLLLGGLSRCLTSPGFKYQHSTEVIDPDHSDGRVGAHAFEGIGAFLFTGRVQKPVNI